MSLRPLINNLFLTFTVVLSGSAFALPTDRDEPIYVEADSANIDEAKGITRYTGDVVITQGSMVLKGDTVDLLRGKDDTINQIISKGTPAYFEQRPQLDQEITYATGTTLDYTVSSQLLLITGSAKVTQGGDEFTGAKINYDMANSKVKAFSSESGRQRVKRVLQPKQDN